MNEHLRSVSAGIWKLGSSHASHWFDEAIRGQLEFGVPGRGSGFQWWTYNDGAVSARGIFGQGIFIDPARNLVIASNSNWPRATMGLQADAREAFYRQVRALIDAEKLRQ